MGRHHDEILPAKSEEYRAARDRLLDAGIALRAGRPSDPR